MVVDTDLVQVIARRNAHWSHGYNFIAEKLLFVVKILKYGVRQYLYIAWRLAQYVCSEQKQHNCLLNR